MKDLEKVSNLANFKGSLPPEFYIKEYPTEGIAIVNYMYSEKDTWTPSWRRYLRGAVYDLTTGNRISCPLPKFFNLGEKEFTQYSVLKKYSVFGAYDKMDGSMITAFRSEKTGKLYLATRGSIWSDQATEATRWMNRNPSLWEEIGRMVDANFTPVFEWVSPTNPVVVPYTEPRLVLLAMVDRDTALPWNNIASPFARPEEYELTLDEAIEFVDDLEGKEGIVLYMTDPVTGIVEIVKLKSQWYTDRHRVVMNLASSQRIAELIVEEKIDDMRSLINPAIEPHVEKIERIVHNKQRELVKKFESINEFWKTYFHETRKDAALYWQPKETPQVFREIMNAYGSGHGIDAVEAARRVTKELVYKKNFVFPELTIDVEG